MARIFESDREKYDVVLIVSDDKESFHDPQICFTAQNYTILSATPINIPTQSRGEIPATLVRMNSPQGTVLAAYFYRGPEQFHASPVSVKWSMFWEQFTSGQTTKGVFYRFIPMRVNVPESQLPALQRELLSFIGEYMDASGKLEDGVF